LRVQFYMYKDYKTKPTLQQSKERWVNIMYLVMSYKLMNTE